MDSRPNDGAGGQSRKRGPVIAVSIQDGSSSDSFDDAPMPSPTRKRAKNDVILDRSSVVQAVITPEKRLAKSAVVKRSPRITLASQENCFGPQKESEYSPSKSGLTAVLNRERRSTDAERKPPTTPIPAVSDDRENSIDSFDLTPLKRVEETATDDTTVDSFDLSPGKIVYCRTNVAETTVDSFDVSPGKIVDRTEVCDNSVDSFDNECVLITAPPILRKDSGVPDFPSLSDPTNTFLLTVRQVNSDANGVFDVICADKDGEEIIVYLQGQWSSSSIDNGSKIRIIGAQKWGEKDWIVDDEHGVLVVDPDTLVPCTAIAGASWCPRKVVLNDRFRSGGEANKAMLIGCIMHELFQVAVDCPDPSVVCHDWLLDCWRSTISTSVMEALVALNFTPKGFETELGPYAEIIVSWVRSHMSGRGNIFSMAAPLPTGSKISEVHDIEENIWEPLLGVKGKIDASLKTLNNGKAQIEPLELKTGKSAQSFEHAGQVLLYCMMLSSRYEQSIASGSLLYLKDGVTRPVEPKQIEMKSVIGLRNRLAYHLEKLGSDKLPEPRPDPHFCGKCEQALTCSLYQTNIDTSVNATEKFRAFALQQISHLNTVEIEYFTRWVRWIYAEWNCDLRSKRRKTSDLWNVDPDTRESFGQCAASMTLASSTKVPEGTGVLLRFERADPIREGFLSAGSMCTVSTDNKYGIVLALVTDSDAHSVTVRSDRLFRLLKLGDRFHLDSYDSYSTYSTTLGNVSMLMMPDEFSTRHRSLIVGLTPPSLADPLAVSALPQKVLRIIAEAHLSRSQQIAVSRSIMTTDYALIEGFPGAGKTTTIVVLVRCLVEMGRSVLLCSFTNSAVDNIIVKLMKHLPTSALLRLGKRSSFRSEVSPITLTERLAAAIEMAGTDYDEYQLTRNILKNTPVVACTCHHTSREVLFSWRKFDICIIDEASMVLEPVSLSALACSSRFVLVGDTKQLAPLVQDRTARDEGMGISLFERLHVHEHVVLSLVEQFRMNRVISSIASSLFYSDKLVCANDDVAVASLNRLKGYSKATTTDSSWSLVLSGRLDDSCVFIDTQSKDQNKNRVEHRGAGLVSNQGEAAIVTEAVRRFLECGLSANDVGVMCVYRKQVDVIRALFVRDGIQDVEVNTVDQYQGRDKTLIIWSLVWTSDSPRACELLLDSRRVNVALTRSRRKMVVVGCRSSMADIPQMDEAARRMNIVPVPLIVQ